MYNICFIACDIGSGVYCSVCSHRWEPEAVRWVTSCYHIL